MIKIGLYSLCAATACIAETLQLDVVSYTQLMKGDRDALDTVDRALHQKGIVGVRGVPGYQEAYQEFIQAARAFSSLPEEIKETYKPNRDLGETFLGYESGKEQFQRPDGTWVIDDLKTSYYAYVPDTRGNKWPEEVNLRDPFEQLGQVMATTGEMVMHAIGLLGDATGLELEEEGARLGRMLYYRKSDSMENPYWCGAHYDHGLFTAILPAVYFVNGEQLPEPEEAGLFVRVANEEPFRKVAVEEEDIMMFQVGEFGQLVTDDKIRATEHRVHKAEGAIERYTLALFYAAPNHKPIYSTSVLTKDARYGANPGEACTYQQWSDASFRRYIVNK